MMKIGTAKTDITPDPGACMSAFPTGPDRKPRVSEDIRDPLEARAIVLDDGTTRIAICSCDLTIIDKWDVDDIRALVENMIPELGNGRIMIAVTHTHSSARTTARFGPDLEEDLMGTIKDLIAETIIAAAENLEPVTLSFASTHVALNHNRRVTGENGKSRMVMEYDPEKTTGPIDDELSVLRFDSPEGKVKAILFNYSAHALTLGPANRSFSADYPGEARNKIESAFPESLALFVNGAAGNLHPRQCMQPDDSALLWMGASLADATVAAARQAQLIPDPVIEHCRKTLTFPNRMDSLLEVEVEIGLVRIGSLCIGFLPGEVFVEFQLAFKQAMAPLPACLIGYANGWPGYVPTTASYDEGGYGVDRFPTDPPALSRTALPQGAGERILSQLLTLAKQFH